MKRIGILYGRERAFPGAIMERVAEMGAGRVEVEPITLGGIDHAAARPFDLILDRISHQVEFYASALRKYELDGTVVVPTTGSTTTTDRLLAGAVAQSAGVATPRRVALPSREHPAEVGAESLTNLRFPLDWERIFEIIGFPALLRPLHRGTHDAATIVHDADELFRAYAGTGSRVMVLEEILPVEARYRCFVVGAAVRAVPDQAEAPTGRFAADPSTLAAELRDRITSAAVRLARAFRTDMAAFDFFETADGTVYLADAPSMRPIAEPELLGEANFRWLADATASWLVSRLAEQKPDSTPEPVATLDRIAASAQVAATTSGLEASQPRKRTKGKPRTAPKAPRSAKAKSKKTKEVN